MSKIPETYGLKISIPDDWSDERKIESLNNWINIIKTFSEVAGEDPTEAIKPLQDELAKLAKDKPDANTRKEQKNG